MIISEICYKKNIIQIIFFSVVISCTTQSMLHSQNQKIFTKPTLKKSISTQKSGMVMLGSWATLNIVAGSVGYYISTDDSKYFHQMNAAWNLVNLGIAGFGYRGASRLDPDLGYDQALDKMQHFDSLLLLNAGLDVLYITGGALLWKRGLEKNSLRQTGYGKSIVLQGGFLLFFDITLYLIHSRHTKNLLDVSEQITFTGNGFRFSF